MKYFDSHIHLNVQTEEVDFSYLKSLDGFCFCTEDFFKFEIAKNKKVAFAFGIHPWSVNEKNISELILKCEKTFSENSDCINCIGEIGLDFFNDELKSQKKLQQEIFEYQLDVAIKLNKSVVIHSRKSLPEIFQFAKKLSEIRAVVFHAFPGNYIEAESLLKKNINAFFSVGGNFLFGKKNTIDLAKNISLKRLLLETDFPFMKKSFSVEDVYAEVLKLRGENCEKFSEQIEKNFLSAYNFF